MRTLAGRAALGGGVVWVIYVGFFVPNLHHGAWAHALLLLAALVLVPLTLDLVDRETSGTEPAGWKNAGRMLQVPAALLLTWACAREPGFWPAAASIPWVVVCGFTALRGCWRFTKDQAWRSCDTLCLNAAMVFLGIGGAWVFADRLGFRPLDFADAIVTLTAVHFHFAGLLLPTAAGMIVRAYPSSRFASLSGKGVVVLVPALAGGITATQLGGTAYIEAIVGSALALCGAFVAVLHVRLALESRHSVPVRVLFLVAGVSLFFGMLLAGAYSIRSISLPLPWLDIPWMRALHGTANALGFGLCGLLGWRAYQGGGAGRPLALRSG